MRAGLRDFGAERERREARDRVKSLKAYGTRCFLLVYCCFKTLARKPFRSVRIFGDS